MANWTLKRITIHRKDYGLYDSKPSEYVGSIEFGNRKQEQFTVNIPPHLLEKYLHLIRETVILSANDLAEKITAEMWPEQNGIPQYKSESIKPIEISDPYDFTNMVIGSVQVKQPPTI